jgi:hypothetical protein
MWLDMFEGFTEVPISYPIRDALRRDHYEIKFDDPTVCNEIEYEKFDYNIVPEVDSNNPYANALVNEMWPFLRLLWKIRGGYEMTVKFNPEIDSKEFGASYGACLFDAIWKFKIDRAGKWHADFYTKFDQIDNPYDDREPAPLGRKGPFYAQDYSRIQANTAKRARKLARPTWSEDDGRSGQDFSDLLKEEERLNKTIDFSFEHHYIGEGDWGDYKDYEVAVSNTTRTIMPEKEAMTAKEAMSLSQISKPKAEPIAVVPIINIKKRAPVTIEATAHPVTETKQEENKQPTRRISRPVFPV